jgi:hypothetical protein
MLNRVNIAASLLMMFQTREEDTGKVPPSKNYHYSRCQLFLGNYEFPPSKISVEPQTVPYAPNSVFGHLVMSSPL